MLGRISSATEDGIRVRTQFFDQIFIPFSGLPEGSELYVLLQPYCPPELCLPHLFPHQDVCSTSFTPLGFIYPLLSTIFVAPMPFLSTTICRPYPFHPLPPI